MACNRPSSGSSSPPDWFRGLNDLLVKQQVILSDLLGKLGDDARVYYILATCPEVRYEAALRDCFQHCKNCEVLILEITFFDEGRRKIAGPVKAADGTILLSSPPLWDIAYFDVGTED